LVPLKNPRIFGTPYQNSYDIGHRLQRKNKKNKQKITKNKKQKTITTTTTKNNRFELRF